MAGKLKGVLKRRWFPGDNVGFTSLPFFHRQYMTACDVVHMTPAQGRLRREHREPPLQEIYNVAPQSGCIAWTVDQSWHNDNEWQSFTDELICNIVSDGFGAVILAEMFPCEAVGLIYKLAMCMGVDRKRAGIYTSGDAEFLHQFEHIACTPHIDLFTITLVACADLIPACHVIRTIHALHSSPHGFFISHITCEQCHAQALQVTCLCGIAHRSVHLMSRGA